MFSWACCGVGQAQPPENWDSHRRQQGGAAYRGPRAHKDIAQCTAIWAREHVSLLGCHVRARHCKRTMYGTASDAPLQAMRGALRCAGAGAVRTWPGAALAACDYVGSLGWAVMRMLP